MGFVSGRILVFTTVAFTNRVLLMNLALDANLLVNLLDCNLLDRCILGIECRITRKLVPQSIGTTITGIIGTENLWIVGRLEAVDAGIHLSERRSGNSR
jgi:hypothetical protein